MQGVAVKVFAALVLQIMSCRQHLRCFWYGSDAVVDCWWELDGCYASVDTSYMRFLHVVQLALGFWPAAGDDTTIT